MALVGNLGDNQRKVYEAQEAIRPWRQFDTLDEIQTWLDSLSSSNWWASRYPDITRIEATASPSRVCSVARQHLDEHYGIIALTPEGMNERTVLHEVAHCVAPPNAKHSGAWVREFLVLTSLALGVEKYLELYNAFSMYNVDLG